MFVLPTHAVLPRFAFRLVLAGMLAAVLGHSAALAQNGAQLVSGRVIDTETGQVAELVAVTVDSLKLGTTTNLDGDFELKLPPGQHTITVKAIGYDVLNVPVEVKDQPVTGLKLNLEVTTYNNIEDVVIKPSENPANRIIKNAIKNRDNNRIDNYPEYEYKAYDKTTISIDNISNEKLNKAFFKPAKEFLDANKGDSGLIDTISNKLKVGIFIKEAIRRVYHKEGRHKERIEAENVYGIAEKELQFVTNVLTNVDVYDDKLSILEKDFLSPISAGALMNYRFYLFDTIVSGTDSIFGMQVVPRNDFDRVFKGTIWIENGSWAVKKVSLRMNASPNINFVEDIRIRQEFDKTPEGKWIPKYRDLEIDFNNKDKNTGFIGRTVTFIDSFALASNRDSKFYGGELIDYVNDGLVSDSTFWAQNRTNKLERSDKMTYQFIDQIKGSFVFKFINFATSFVSNGRLTVGKVDLGPYLKTVGFNPIEGFRMQWGVYSNNTFHKRWGFGAHLAYGTRDQRFKYDAEVRYKIRIKPKIEIALSRTQDVQQLGYRNYELDGVGFLNSVLMRVPLTQLNYYTENNLRIKADLTRWLSGQMWLKTRYFEPAFAFFYQDGGQLRSSYNITELGLSTRWSIGQKYMLRNGERVYMDSKYPTFYADAAYGIKGFLGGEYNYFAASLTMAQKIRWNRIGWTNYTLTGGVVLGTVPYPSLYIYKGSQSFVMDPNGYYAEALSSLLGAKNRTSIYDPVGFNLMYFYEFASDKYVMFGFDHHFENWLFNKIPGVRWLMNKLKVKELAGFRMAWGTLTDANRAMNSPQTGDPRVQENGITPNTPDRMPYMEVNVGLENILKVLRVDFVWRLSHLNPKAPGQLAGYDYNFGVRVYVGISF